MRAATKPSLTDLRWRTGEAAADPLNGGRGRNGPADVLIKARAPCRDGLRPFETAPPQAGFVGSRLRDRSAGKKDDAKQDQPDDFDYLERDVGVVR